jgi:hypothetical protein
MFNTNKKSSIYCIYITYKYSAVWSWQWKYCSLSRAFSWTNCKYSIHCSFLCWWQRSGKITSFQWWFNIYLI